MDKADILSPYIKNVKSGFGTYEMVDKDKALLSMQEFADQENEKVAVAFSEWVGKEGYSWDSANNLWTRYIEKTGEMDSMINSDLYQYWIENVYNK